MTHWHWIRPYWLWTILPLILLAIGLARQQSSTLSWASIAEAHLIEPLLIKRGRSARGLKIVTLMLGLLAMIIALAGPSWTQNPIPTYKHRQARMILLDLSPAMLAQDKSPDRLSRAKFKIHDLLAQKDVGQFGLMVYTAEPFVLSPLTDDAQTIDALLDVLNPDIMPISGHRLELALDETGQMFNELGLSQGEILVLTANIPSIQAVDSARKLANHGLHVSVIPIIQDPNAWPLFNPLAQAGLGDMIPLRDDNKDIRRWLARKDNRPDFQRNLDNDIPLWRDEGRWFLALGLVLMLPLFRSGFLRSLSQ